MLVCNAEYFYRCLVRLLATELWRNGRRKPIRWLARPHLPLPEHLVSHFLALCSLSSSSYGFDEQLAAWLSSTLALPSPASASRAPASTLRKARLDPAPQQIGRAHV